MDLTELRTNPWLTLYYHYFSHVPFHIVETERSSTTQAYLSSLAASEIVLWCNLWCHFIIVASVPFYCADTADWYFHFTGNPYEKSTNRCFYTISRISPAPKYWNPTLTNTTSIIFMALGRHAVAAGCNFPMVSVLVNCRIQAYCVMHIYRT